MIKKEKNEQIHVDMTTEEREVINVQPGDALKGDVAENIETLSSLAYLMLSQESRDQMEQLFCKDDEKENNDDWKDIALEIMRKVDARQREAETVEPLSFGNLQIKDVSRAKTLSEEALHQAILKVTDQEERELNEEMKHAKPHVFSAEFEHKMEELMKVQTPEMKTAKRKKKFLHAAQYTAAAIVTVALLGGLLFSGNKNVTASQMKFRITQWLENAFVVEEGAIILQDEGILFDKNQIGYIPDGFKLEVEEIAFSKKYYKYLNDQEEFIVLNVGKNIISLGVDNEKIEQEAHVSSLGLEYRYINTEDNKTNGIFWVDKKEQVYILSGSINIEELMNIMNNISYKGE